MKLRNGLAAMLLVASTAVGAANTLIAPQTSVAVAKSSLTVTADREWNKMGPRPGPSGEIWTFDGAQLNQLAFFGGIATDTGLFREISTRNRPLPQFKSTMLVTDIPALFENSYRVAYQINVMSVGQIEPTTFAGYQGVRFAYDYTPLDEVQRKGEGYAAIVDGRLYMITFEAPALHFFDAGIAPARAVVASARFAAKKK